MSRIAQIALIILDSAGIGDAPDAADWDDEGSNTLGNLSRAVGGVTLPTLQRLGLGNLTQIEGVPPTDETSGAYGRMTEQAAGNDTVIGHWEMMGQIRMRPFPTYPHGFPDEIIEEFEKRTGRPVIGNRAASGTVIIEELAEKQREQGAWIVYTSADSVFQIAAHTDVIPLEELYDACEIARAMLCDEWEVSRVIARPYVGEPGSLTRTDERKDYPLPPPGPTALDHLQSAGIKTVGVGKIEDIFAGQGIGDSVHIGNNEEGAEAIRDLLRKREHELIFANLNDFDSKYGHRNDPQGYAECLERADAEIAQILDLLDEDALMIITADHGTDPTTESTDHTRERVPLLVAGPQVRPVDLGTRDTYADLGATLCELFGAEPLPVGTSFAGELLEVRA
ncbi:MAG: phosphopentomutase [Armatimonadota bacterium]